ncbi:Thiamine transporter 2 [Cryptotermes secundus]|uniref:Thiamine transporter 2 n=1 Tax=Cryptotermes secundus TaxID=105785 RepID=A0A2J7QI48_9NEOP|nr:folate transporter 1 [Cryptotermes secundus]XP_023712949.1 folate transporter 1 [Cryptotermes secundus]XP_023712950.1 folate transporter 1 [Cryptotermes secundus]PNF28260.1 Thiamine transporter 2 [Cryptotermes secundus]
MEIWLKLSILLCVFGFVKEFRPSEPFVTPYLTEEGKNFTDQDIEVIFSTGTYAYLVEIIFVFLVTDLFRYKPVIVLDGVFAIITWSLLIWGKSILQMQVMEVFYAFFLAAEVAYYTYIYAQVDREHYQKVTSHTRAAYLFGRALSGIVSQTLVSTGTLNYYQLNFISFAAVISATVWALFLPPVKHSIYFNRTNIDRQDVITGNEHHGVIIEDSVSKVPSPELSQNAYAETHESMPHSVETHDTSRLQNVQKGLTNRWKIAYYYLWKDFTSAYTNTYVVKWSCWWALATCGFLQVLNYIQLVWELIITENNMDSNTELYHGAVEAIYTVIGATASLGCGWLRLNWQMVGEATLAICSLIEGTLLIVSTMANSLPAAYTYYILFGIIFHTMITVANTEIAEHLNENSYGLIFGVNTFLALVFQSILTVIVVDERVLALDTRTQFLVYGGYYMVLGILFGCMSVFTLCKKEIRGQKLWLPKETE